MGEKHASADFGWKRLECGAVVVCDQEQKVLRCIEECRSHGMSYRQILEELVNAGVVTSRLRCVLVRKDIRG